MSKILFVATTDTHVANFHMPFIEALIGQGHEVHVAASGTGRAGEIEGRGAFFRDIPFPRTLRAGELVMSYIRLSRLCRAERYDLIHVHTPISAAITRLAVPRRNCRILYTSHGFYFYKGLEPKRRLFYYAVERMLAPRTDMILAMNEEDFQAARRFKGCDVRKIPGVGIDVDSYRDTFGPGEKRRYRDNLGIMEDDKVIIMIAELTKRKNHMKVLSVMEELVRLNGRARLLLVGDGDLRGHLEKEVEARSLTGCVTFLGQRRDIAELLGISDVLVNASFSEGLPRCVMEAMAASKPVVASRIRGHVDLIEDGKGGCLFGLSDEPEAIARTLNELIGDEELRNRMGSHNAGRITEYSISKVLPVMMGIYSGLLGGNAGGQAGKEV